MKTLKGKVTCGSAVIFIFISLVHAATVRPGVPRNHKQIAFPLAYFRTTQDPAEILVTLNPNGFDPAELRIPAGRFLLSLDNRSGVTELVLRLAKADGTQLRELRISGGSGDWSELLDLPVGTYTLAEANHSNWVCQLIVHAN